MLTSQRRNATKIFSSCRRLLVLQLSLGEVPKEVSARKPNDLIYSQVVGVQSSARLVVNRVPRIRGIKNEKDICHC
jgi:hypothetical protein